MYYRVAIQGASSLTWQWKSTPLSSLNTILQWLQFYQFFPKNRLRIFSSPSCEEMNEQLARENLGLRSSSVMAAQFLQERLIGTREMVGEVVAIGPRGIELPASIEFACNDRSKGVHRPNERGSSFLEKRRFELELGVGGDHDILYQFTLPSSMTQVLVWIKLLVRVRDGTLQP